MPLTLDEALAQFEYLPGWEFKREGFVWHFPEFVRRGGVQPLTLSPMPYGDYSTGKFRGLTRTDPMTDAELTEIVRLTVTSCAIHEVNEKLMRRTGDGLSFVRLPHPPSSFTNDPRRPVEYIPTTDVWPRTRRGSLRME